jgi:hypothetical protein
MRTVHTYTHACHKHIGFISLCDWNHGDGDVKQLHQMSGLQLLRVIPHEISVDGGR